MSSNPTLTTAAEKALSPFANYRSVGDRYDEYFSATGEGRLAWQLLAKTFDQLGSRGIETQSLEIDRMVRESGANFGQHRHSEARPWTLDLIPFLIDRECWQRIEEGVIQRTRVLEAVLCDLLGPQELLKHRVLPPELLYANPSVVRAYFELPAPSQRLNLTAVDLARDDDGSWWVTGDRTRAPSGLGFTLENRVISTRVLPHSIRDCHVTRLASFFCSMQDHFQSLGNTGGASPRVAILTPGEASYRYAEDAYLARYLGYTLVQGRDLAVRGRRIHLKTLGGLCPIDILLRHVSDAYCDPIELDGNSSQGATGLLGVVRASKLVVANSLGSVIAQTPALLRFLPAASQFLFGEDLVLPSVPTYWCGSTADCDYVLNHLDELMVQDAFQVTGRPPLDPSQMSIAEKSALRDQIKSAPHQYIGQVRPARSRTPVWHQGKLHSWHVALRSFQFHSQCETSVLPGGLVRVSPDPLSLDHSPSSGRLGLDCWIVGDHRVTVPRTLLPSDSAPVELKRSGAELPSRVAENFYWLGRYAERAEAIARLLRTSVVRLADEALSQQSPELPRLMAVLAAMGQLEPDYAIDGLNASMPSLEIVLPRSLSDWQKPSGLTASIRQMVENAMAVRDRISMDAYRLITGIEEQFLEPIDNLHLDLHTLTERLNRLVSSLLAFSGVNSQSMTRTHAWRFLEIGRNLERVHQTAELIDCTLVQPIHDLRPLLESVLETTDSLMTYRSRYLQRLQVLPVIDLLVTDETNPRSLVYQLRNAVNRISEIPTGHQDEGYGVDQMIANQTLAEITSQSPLALSNAASNGYRVHLRRQMSIVMERVAALSDAITSRYLIHSGTHRELLGRTVDSKDSNASQMQDGMKWKKDKAFRA
jgi:uncharacterized circularly permuted ATP-grasp superfamily protein/uncharacterized alpha-E superfamily protein